MKRARGTWHLYGTLGNIEPFVLQLRTAKSEQLNLSNSLQSM